MYYVEKTKGADQQCDCHAADLCLCFSHMQKANFLMTRLKCTLKKAFNDLSIFEPS